MNKMMAWSNFCELYYTDYRLIKRKKQNKKQNNKSCSSGEVRPPAFAIVFTVFPAQDILPSGWGGMIRRGLVGYK